MKKLSSILISTAAMAIGLSAQTSVVWDGSVDNDWSNANNWTPATLPTIGNNAIGTINAGDTASPGFTTTDYQIVQDGGTVSWGSNKVFSGGSWTLNDGLIDANARYILQSGHALNVNGGTVGINSFRSQSNSSSVTFGGSSAGTFTITNYDQQAGSFDWLSGSQISMSITGSTTWAETEYNADRLLFNGDDATTLGLTWTQVTSGGTQIWNFSSDTLSLVPEPSAFALLAGMFGFALVMLRRRV